jgi:hypothetical protein
MDLTLKHHKYLKTISRSWTPNLILPNLNAIMKRPPLRKVKVGWGIGVLVLAYPCHQTLEEF